MQTHAGIIICLCQSLIPFWHFIYKNCAEWSNSSNKWGKATWNADIPVVIVKSRFHNILAKNIFTNSMIQEILI